MISTPILAIEMDLSNAIMLTLLPTIILNFISIRSVKRWEILTKKHFPFAIVALIGSMIGTLILVEWNAHWMKLILAIMIVLYLLLDKLNINLEFIHNSKKISFIYFSLIGGFIGGISNIMAPVLIIYSLVMSFPKEESIVFMNLSFLFGKLSQSIIFIFLGQWIGSTILIYMLIPSLIGFFAGVKIKKIIPEKRYKKVIKVLLFFIAIAIVARFLSTSI